MAPVGREPGDSTMIRVSILIRDYLEKQKLNKEEAIGDVVERIIKENRELKKIREP